MSVMSGTYPLSEIARIGALFLDGDVYEEVMPEFSRSYTDTDFLEYREQPFNALKRVLLLIERIESQRAVIACLWGLRGDNAKQVEVIVAGSHLPIEGYDVREIWTELQHAFDGKPAQRMNDAGETAYYPLRNSLEDVVAVLEVTEYKTNKYFFI